MDYYWSASHSATSKLLQLQCLFLVNFLYFCVLSPMNYEFESMTLWQVCTFLVPHYTLTHIAWLRRILVTQKWINFYNIILESFNEREDVSHYSQIVPMIWAISWLKLVTCLKYDIINYMVSTSQTNCTRWSQVCWYLWEDEQWNAWKSILWYY